MNETGTTALMLRGQITRIQWIPPDDLTEEQWRAVGALLDHIEAAVGWWIGDWWRAHKPAWGTRADLFKDDWTGPSYSTCRNAGTTCAAFDIDRRRANLPFKHHTEVAGVKDPAVADALLDWCAETIAETGEPRSTRELRARVKQRRRALKELDLSEKTKAAWATLGDKVWAVLQADPPWRFEPYSRESGMDRAADNHYPTMTIDELLDMKAPAAADAVLFLWATVPMLPQAQWVMAAWGFDYKSHFIWWKDHPGTGYWNRNNHELLLVGTRGDVPAPAPGEQFLSVVEAPLGPHSQKPTVFSEMIEEMYPTAPKVELFARRHRDGWDAWGNEVPAPVAEVA